MIHHMSINIKGFLEVHPRKGSLDGIATDNVGRDLSDTELRHYLHECLKKGWRVLPMSSDCDNFDYQTGCKGHEEKEPASAATDTNSTN